MPENKRHHGRIRTRFETLYCSERQEGAGILLDISYSGARLGDTHLQPRLGARVRVHVMIPGSPNPLELVGEVVRHTEGGFAIGCAKPSAQIRQLVDDVAALVNVPEEG